MTTNKPEVFEVYRTKQGTLENVVLLADYEALQAECEKLRKDAERYRHLRDRLTGPRFDNLFFLELYNAGCFDYPDDVDEAIDAAIQKEHNP